MLEAGDLTSGSTWHAAGLCTQFHNRLERMRVLESSVELYESGLAADTGVDVGYHR